MKYFKRALTLFAFSLVFLLAFVPVGFLIRSFADPLRLRKGARLATYFNMARKGVSLLGSSCAEGTYNRPAHKS